jgi:hypothetical protein
MAIEGTYKELAAGYDLTKTVNGITATRQFIDSYPGATDSLPEMGDKLSETDEVLKTVVVTTVRETYYGNDCTQKLFVVSYSNTPGTSDDPDEITNSDPDQLPISGGLSGEAINIDTSTTGSLFIFKDDRTKPKDQQLFKKIITGTFKVSRRVANLEVGTWAQYSGKINKETFKIAGTSFGPGLVMFDGADYEEYFNSKGERRFKVGYSFTIKAQPAGTGMTGYYGWNYFFDQETGKFREVVAKSKTAPTDASKDQPLYESANLASLISGVEEP